jgi:hypothetical protein
MNELKQICNELNIPYSKEEILGIDQYFRLITLEAEE